MKPHRLAFILVWSLLGLTGSAQTVDTVITNGLFEPYGVTVDSGNSYYIADSANHRIAKYDPDTGFLTTLAGQVGQSGYTDGPGFFARFNSPRGVVYARSTLGDVRITIPPGSRAIVTVSASPLGRVRADPSKYAQVEPGVYATVNTGEPPLETAEQADLDVQAGTVFGSIYLS